MFKKEHKLKKERIRYIFEIVLILAAVLIFRSSWMILDSYEIFSRFAALILMLVIGIIATIIAFTYLFKHEIK